MIRNRIHGLTAAGAVVPILVDDDGKVIFSSAITIGAVTGPLTDTELRATAVPVSGTVTASGPVTDAQLRAAPVPVKGPTVASATLSNVESSATSVAVLASNANRKQFRIENDSSAVLYVKLGTTASATDYSIKLAAGAAYESNPLLVYTGAIHGIWASANGYARVTELA